MGLGDQEALPPCRFLFGKSSGTKSAALRREDGGSRALGWSIRARVPGAASEVRGLSHPECPWGLGPCPLRRGQVCVRPKALPQREAPSGLRTIIVCFQQNIVPSPPRPVVFSPARPCASCAWGFHDRQEQGPSTAPHPGIGGDCGFRRPQSCFQGSACTLAFGACETKRSTAHGQRGRCFCLAVAGRPVGARLSPGWAAASLAHL